MLELRKSIWVQAILALVSNAFTVSMWLVFDLPIAIVPALLIPPWITLMATSREPVSPGELSLLKGGGHGRHGAPRVDLRAPGRRVRHEVERHGDPPGGGLADERLMVSSHCRLARRLVPPPRGSRQMPASQT